MDIETIETARLRLRALAAGDADRLWQIWSEEPVQRHLITVPHSRGEFDEMFRTMKSQSEAGHLWGIEDKATGQLLGRCGFYLWDGQPPPEFAILLSEASWGRGLGTEATLASLDFAFARVGWMLVVAVARTGNLVVRRLLQRAGFQEGREQEIKGAPAVWLSATARRPQRDNRTKSS